MRNIVQLNSLLALRSSSLAIRLSAQACVCLIAFLLLAVPARSQVSAILSGTVTDPSGAAVPASTVTAKNVDTGALRGAVTDAGGHYQFLALPVGQYEIRGAKAGFTEVVRTGVFLAVGQSATADIHCRSVSRASKLP